MIDIPIPLYFAANGFPTPTVEYKFHPTRKWRWDYCYPDLKIAVEVQGGVWIRGKHGRGSGIIKDYAKFNAGQALGWIVLQFTPQDIRSGEFASLLSECLHARMGTTLPASFSTKGEARS